MATKKTRSNPSVKPSPEKTAAKKPAAKKPALKKPVLKPISQASEKKPLISLGALITLVVFAALTLLAVYLSRQKQAAETKATPVFQEPQYLFDKSLTVSAIEVKPAAGETVKLKRGDNGWTFELPQAGEAADQGAVEAAASQILALRLVDAGPFDLKLADVGLQAPEYVISVTFSDGKTRVLEIGDPTPINTGYYVRLDQGPIQVIGLSGVDALTSLATNPPYPPTPTPAETETPAVTPTP